MNPAAPAPVRVFVYITVLTLVFTSASPGEVRSGFWTLLYPPSTDSIRSHVDFSVLASFCRTEGGSQKCSLAVTDCYFRNDTVFAPYGGYYDSSASANLQAQFIAGKAITSTDRDGLFYLDSMMKKIVLKSPQNGFRNFLPGRSGVFFVKTSENRNAVMIKTGEYIGGINRIWYYWAYQPDSSDALFKNRLALSSTSAFSITANVFSGRTDPFFSLTDSAAIALITHAALAAMNPYLDATVQRNNTDSCPERLGYGKLTVYGNIEPENPMSSYMPNIEICAGKITYYKSPPAPRRYFYDKDSRLEKLIIRIGCEKNLTATDSYGTVRFCDIVPDSLKTIASPGRTIAPETGGSRAVTCRVKYYEIQFSRVPPGEARVDCFSLSGKCVASIKREGIGDHALTFDVREYAVGNGAYILRLSHQGLKTRSMVFPVLIYR